MQYLPSSVSPSHNAGLRLSSPSLHLTAPKYRPKRQPQCPQHQDTAGGAGRRSCLLASYQNLPPSFCDAAPPAQRHCVLVPFPCTQTPPALHHLLEVLNGAGAALGTMPMAPGEISLNLESGTTHCPTQQRHVCFQ